MSAVVVDFAHRSLPAEGFAANGDRVVTRIESSFTLLALIDAAGHGPRAEEVALAGVASLDAMVPPFAADEVMDALDRSMKGRRGGAATAVCVHDGQVSAAGVGNVVLRLHPSCLSFVNTPGILGRRMRSPRLVQGPLPPEGLRIVLHSDGISRRLNISDLRPLTPAEACERVIGHRHSHDDATILIADLKTP